MAEHSWDHETVIHSFALIHAHIPHLSAELKHSHFTYSSLNVGWKRKQKQSTSIENKRSVISQSHGMSGPRDNFQATHAQPRHSVDAAQTSFYPSTLKKKKKFQWACIVKRTKEMRQGGGDGQKVQRVSKVCTRAKKCAPCVESTKRQTEDNQKKKKENNIKSRLDGPLCSERVGLVRGKPVSRGLTKTAAVLKTGLSRLVHLCASTPVRMWGWLSNWRKS